MRRLQSRSRNGFFTSLKKPAARVIFFHFRMAEFSY
jgi:hypothetical protein